MKNNLVCSIKNCEEDVICLTPKLCSKHFVEYFEKKVLQTIKKYKLFSKKENIVVAVSGGKDSLSILHILNKYKYNFSAVVVDEGIPNYRLKTIKHLTKYCKENKISLNILSFKKEFGKSLTKIIKSKYFKNTKPCSICGVLRRYLLNKYSNKFQAIVTGHNLDDESQSIMMNIIKGSPESNLRLGVITGASKNTKFTKRVKPLYFLKEKEVMIYAYLNNLVSNFYSCPNSKSSSRNIIKELLNKIESNFSGTKEQIVLNNLKTKKSFNLKTSQQIKYCKICGMPSSKNICKTCEIVLKINKK